MTTLLFKTALGPFTVQLEDSRAPITVKNFVRYVNEGAFTEGAFERVVTPETSGNDLLPGERPEEGEGLPNGDVPINVVQGGPAPGSKEHEPIRIETTQDTGLHHVDGTLSMGRLGPDTATTEFFFCLGDQPQLDFGGDRNPDGQGFAAFGQVTSGMDVVRAIHAAPSVGQDLVPFVRIDSVVVVDA
ncbi:MAG: peptidylprolyl isomerase [Galactobacter sp.]|uniref:peptidylprolyl isomerase n=1 Tax=Galactobacter sp. TaxID=2676125 RepID=UPI0025C3D453|nr:peptidylprolyl isomerase [Galactobacter sp.]